MVTAWKRSCSESMLAVDNKWEELFDMLARAVTFVDRSDRSVEILEKPQLGCVKL
jgi:hypothetical protein